MKATLHLHLILLALLFFSPLAICAQQQPRSTPAPAAAEGPAARRVAELIALINSGDRQAARAYAEKNYGGKFAEIPMEMHLGFLSDFHDRTRGVELHSFQEANATEATALVRSKLTGGWETIFVKVEAEAPHRIVGIGGRAPKPPASSSSAKALTDEEKVRELDSFLQKLAGADVFSGSVLLAKDGRVLFKQAYGEANKDFNVRNRVDTKFNLGSMNKMFTAVAIAQLAERGKLSFDDPLAKFLPDFPSAEAAQKIRIKHLLTHTSGLGSYFNKTFMEASRARFRTVDDMMQLAREEKLAFEPGARWQYSNTGFLVLGKVIEKATGQSYDDYVRENIFRPAGMTNTDAYELDRVNPNLAVGYQKEFGEKGVTFRNNIFEHVIRGGPAGGGYSTAEDLLKFDVALRSHKLVGAEYTRQLLSPKPELNSPQYGYGFGIDTERSIAGHSGGFPGISSNLDMFLTNGYTAIVMSNYGGGSRPVMGKMRELILTGREAESSRR